MVALLVRLKLTLLRNSLRRSAWRTVGLVLGGLYALALVAGALAGAVALRSTSLAVTADVTVVAYAALTAGWLVLSLLVFGVDETVDPSKFALLPVRAAQLQPGLLAAALVGVPGVATVLVGLGLLVAWSRSVPLTLAALVALPLGLATCLLLSRAATAAFAAFLSSRRFRDLAFVVLALLGAGLGLAGNLLGGLVSVGPSGLRHLLAVVGRVAGWTPFGWAWSLPGDLARGQLLFAAAHLVLAVALVVVLWRAWGHFLAARLVEPVEGGGEATRVHGGGWVERLYPVSPAGGVAARTLRYWRRDPRYLAGVAGFLIAPVVVIVVTLTGPDSSVWPAVLSPALMALLVGSSLAADLAYDGSAVWAHISAGVAGAADRLGRVMSMLTVYLPLLVVLLGVAFGLTGRWDLLVPVLALTAVLTLGGLGSGSFVGTLWQWPAPPPGASPFQRGSSGGLPALLSFMVTAALTTLVALPTVALVVTSVFVPWAVWPALAVGLVTGAGALWLGVRWGGRRLDRRWPEVLTAVSERVA